MCFHLFCLQYWNMKYIEMRYIVYMIMAWIINSTAIIYLFFLSNKCKFMKECGNKVNKIAFVANVCHGCDFIKYIFDTSISNLICACWYFSLAVHIPMSESKWYQGIGENKVTTQQTFAVIFFFRLCLQMIQKENNCNVSLLFTKIYAQ